MLRGRKDGPLLALRCLVHGSPHRRRATGHRPRHRAV